MIDLHCHILPGLDDGAADLDEALAMAHIAAEDGISTIIATPHYDGGDRSFPGRAAAECARLNRAIEQRELPVTILLGFELMLTPALADGRSDTMALGLNRASYLLLELPLAQWPPYVDDSLFRLQGLGARPILAHVERYAAVIRDIGLAEDLVGRGVRLQVNADSILGVHGRIQRRCAEQLIERGLVSFVASDAHSAGQRVPRLRAAVDAITRLIGREAAMQLVRDNPSAVVANDDLPPQNAMLSKRHSLFGWLSGRS